VAGRGVGVRRRTCGLLHGRPERGLRIGNTDIGFRLGYRGSWLKDDRARAHEEAYEAEQGEP